MLDTLRELVDTMDADAAVVERTAWREQHTELDGSGFLLAAARERRRRHWL